MKLYVCILFDRNYKKKKNNIIFSHDTYWNENKVCFSPKQIRNYYLLVIFERRFFFPPLLGWLFYGDIIVVRIEMRKEKYYFFEIALKYKGILKIKMYLVQSPEQYKRYKVVAKLEQFHRIQIEFQSARVRQKPKISAFVALFCRRLR